jgi:CRISPR-associated endonuclease/helicase Cas3
MNLVIITGPFWILLFPGFFQGCIKYKFIAAGYVMQKKFIAHYRKTDDKTQLVYEHLVNVSTICGELAGKIGIASVGQLLGLLHDFGKYSHDFQAYIQSATDIINPDLDEEWVDAAGLKGKIDHSTAGAQWVCQCFW